MPLNAGGWCLPVLPSFWLRNQVVFRSTSRASRRLRYLFIIVQLVSACPFNDPLAKIRGKEKVVIHKQHVGFNVEKPYRNVAVTF
jgi:hypothetical protein